MKSERIKGICEGYGATISSFGSYSALYFEGEIHTRICNIRTLTGKKVVEKLIKKIV